MMKRLFGHSQTIQNKHISWREEQSIILTEPAEQTDINLQSPSRETADIAQEQAGESPLDFVVTAPH